MGKYYEAIEKSQKIDKIETPNPESYLDSLNTINGTDDRYKKRFDKRLVTLSDTSCFEAEQIRIL